MINFDRQGAGPGWVGGCNPSLNLLQEKREKPQTLLLLLFKNFCPNER
jgi:hypothetical protein